MLKSGEDVREIASDAPPYAGWLSDISALRVQLTNALHDSGGGHYGGSLSVLDLLYVLHRVLDFKNGAFAPNRLILSKGHAALALYTVQAFFGVHHYNLAEYGTAQSPLQGHPDTVRYPGVEASTGSLGQGLSFGLGMAVALQKKARVWVILGDGECQEGQIWEAAMVGSKLGIAHLTAIVDCNGYQEWGEGPDACHPAPPVSRLAVKWRAFGWEIIEVDGHDIIALHRAIVKPAPAGCPRVILAKTIKGKGFAFSESDPHRFHCTSLTSEQHVRLLRSQS